MPLTLKEIDSMRSSGILASKTLSERLVELLGKKAYTKKEVCAALKMSGSTFDRCVYRIGQAGHPVERLTHNVTGKRYYVLREATK